MLHFKHTFLMLYSENSTYKIGYWHVLTFSLFHPPAAQIDCGVTGFTALHLQNILPDSHDYLANMNKL